MLLGDPEFSEKWVKSLELIGIILSVMVSSAISTAHEANEEDDFYFGFLIAVAIGFLLAALCLCVLFSLAANTVPRNIILQNDAEARMGWLLAMPARLSIWGIFCYIWALVQWAWTKTAKANNDYRLLFHRFLCIWAAICIGGVMCFWGIFYLHLKAGRRQVVDGEEENAPIPGPGQVVGENAPIPGPRQEVDGEGENAPIPGPIQVVDGEEENAPIPGLRQEGNGEEENAPIPGPGQVVEENAPIPVLRQRVTARRRTHQYQD